MGLVRLAHPDAHASFDKTKADDRKGWLMKYDADSIIEQSQKTVTVSEFVDRELIHFSQYDNRRSIPSMVDGLKPSQRKVLFTCLKKNLREEAKVAQLAALVAGSCFDFAACEGHLAVLSGLPEGVVSL